MTPSPLDVLVTGAAGDLGQHVARTLLAEGHAVRALVRSRDTRAEWLERSGASLHDGDLEDERSLHRAARGATGLVHCAARTPRGGDAEGTRRLLVEGTATVLRAARARGVERIVHVSSMFAVGLRRDRAPMDEATPWRGADLPRVPAVHARREAEERVLRAARAGLPAVVVNPDVLVGARADGAPSALVRHGAGGPVPPRGGSAVRIEDAARGCVLALERGEIGTRYVLGGENVDLRALARGLAPESGALAPRIAQAPAWKPAALLLALARGRADDVRLWGWNTFADSTRARDGLGYEPGRLTRP